MRDSDLKSEAFSRMVLYGRQKRKNTPKTQKSNQPVTILVPLEIIIRHMGNNVRLWDWENTGYKRAGGNMLEATGT